MFLSLNCNTKKKAAVQLYGCFLLTEIQSGKTDKKVQ